MDPRSESPGQQSQGKVADADPLASPTLAALYASQGHTDVAKGIYSQLGRRAAGLPSEAADSGRKRSPSTDTILLRRLLSLREAARQVREAGYQSARPPDDL